MKTFREYVETELGATMPKGDIPGSWFIKHGFPMIVRCTCCNTTLSSPSALVDKWGYTYCADCAKVSES